jgi:hypothetical protein
VLKQSRDGSWRVEVRRWLDRSLTPYAADPNDVVVMSSREARRRQWKGLSPEGLVDRVDRLVTIDEDGDVEVWRLHKRLAPANGERKAMPVKFVNTSNRATWEPLNFEDTSEGANEVKGQVEIYPPARRGEPRDVVIGLRGVGVHTFSREYCLRYNGSEEEGFAFTTSTRLRAEHVHLEIALPDLLVDPRPRLEVYRMLGDWDARDHGRSTAELVRLGNLQPDARETIANEAHLRYWPDVARILFDLELPLPSRLYRVCWNLPNDEYEVLDGALRDLREPIRYTVRRLKEELFDLINAPAQRERVHAFLTDLGLSARGRCQVDEDVRIDLAVDDGAAIGVVAGVRLPRGASQPVDSDLRPSCALGERLRGKAFLQRVPRAYAPDIPDSRKDPHRDPQEPKTQHQLSVPLVYPPAPPYWPRVAVLTLSSEEEGGTLVRRLATEEIEWFTTLAHVRVIDLARRLGHPFPELPPGLTAASP